MIEPKKIDDDRLAELMSSVERGRPLSNTAARDIMAHVAAMQPVVNAAIAWLADLPDNGFGFHVEQALADAIKLMYMEHHD